MSALMSDVIEGTVSPSMANATTKAGSQLLRLVEMQYKFGKATQNGTKELLLSPPIDEQQTVDPAQKRLAEIEEIRVALDLEAKSIQAALAQPQAKD